MPRIIFLIAVIVFCYSCSDDDCTKTQTLYRGQQFGGNTTIEVPCDFPDSEPLQPI